MMRSIALLSALLVASCQCHGPDDCADHASRRGPHGAEHGRDRTDDDPECAERPPAADAGAAETGASAAGDGSAPGPDAAIAPADGGVSVGCRLDRDCAVAGVGLVCDARSGACRTPAQCTVDAGCSAGERCLAGRCLGAAAVCQFATDCGAGRDCVDGRCLAACSARNACPTTQACVGGYCDQPLQAGTACERATDCAAGSACADGRCVAACDAARPCPSASVCVLGFCQVDTSPRSFCARDADCAAGSVCRRGSCRAACPGGTAAECLRVDVGFDTCGSDLLCTNPTELRPECARTADCSAATVCINARCR